MPTENNISYDKSINNFIIEIRILLYLTLPQFKRICAFMFGTVGRGCNAKISRITENCYRSRYRTSAGVFFQQSMELRVCFTIITKICN